MRPFGKARGADISGIFERRATPPGGMQRRPNADELLRRDTRVAQSSYGGGDGRLAEEVLAILGRADSAARGYALPWRSVASQARRLLGIWAFVVRSLKARNGGGIASYLA